MNLAIHSRDSVCTPLEFRTGNEFVDPFAQITPQCQSSGPFMRLGPAVQKDDRILSSNTEAKKATRRAVVDVGLLRHGNVSHALS